MKTTVYLIILLITALSTQSSATESNSEISENRISDQYHFIRITGDMNVTLVQNEKPEISLKGTSHQLRSTVTVLRNDTLFVYSTSQKKSGKKLNIRINIDDLVGLEVSGKTKVTCEGYISSDIFSIKADGGSEINIDVRTLKVDSKATGCSQINLSGSTGELAEYANSCSNIEHGYLHFLKRTVRQTA